ncbi:hypothetical protein BBJ41_34720 [Burkholderia stabilis]|uniref:DUF429 domain-containing protein n=1 Tax=Burkholderia stabilis TaxID=95485 RepID=UPI0008517F09|nr:DUF429 domain-containing protein [Burkholderia stabilis]AOR72764.1 hypothetical protein BBJ41_34720 [Burkholderia stabilis]HDR9495714.1 DUF429 domain-containing protein [Burkholderia stabilis]HDR9526543.1 DUF429 domain-containing protein [Burkholderia stabilis]HDR9542393.1 DUF429 domain-containing protein [Burkholderia stabilis]HDR9557313.1 DUF429 domain-containing protein [Burkholderia stabilis]
MRSARSVGSAARQLLAVAGVDVGGDRKQCDLVILRGSAVVCREARIAPEALPELCLAHDVVAVGVDAPSLWWAGAGRRAAEQALARERISCFPTPSREQAVASTSGFFDWMFVGERVYRALADAYPLLTDARYAGGRASFETYPYAITCALLGKAVASAKQKRNQRRQLLEQLGIDVSTLRSVDARDATLCALTAQYVVDGNAHAYGDAEGGYIRVPIVSEPIVLDSP